MLKKLLYLPPPPPPSNVHQMVYILQQHVFMSFLDPCLWGHWVRKKKNIIVKQSLLHTFFLGY